MKITNSKSQITKGVAPPAQKEFQITMTKITKINKKRITTIIMGQEAKKDSWQLAVGKRRNEETTKRGRKEKKRESGINGNKRY